MPKPIHAQETTLEPTQYNIEEDNIEEDAATKKRDALKVLSEKFVDKLSARLKEADFLLSTQGSVEAYRTRPFFEGLLEGEVLIMQISLHHKDPKRQIGITLDQPVITYKKGYDVMVSLLDIINAGSFPIKVDQKTQTASGWFIQESNTFALDVQNKTLEISGKKIPFPKEDVVYQDGDILVKGQTLAEWFKFDLVVNPQGQRMTIYTYESWPAQQRQDRALRQETLASQRKPASEPFKEEAYKIASFPSFDVSLSQDVRRSGAGQTTSETSYNIQGAGDLLNHTMDLSIIGSDTTPLSNVYLNLSKTSKEPNLLGPLKARFYEFNDVRTTQVPLAGNGPTERGFHVTNKSRNFTFDTSTVIDGVAPPGWDVELYRDQIYLAGTATLDDGRYSFEDVRLNAGDNNFYIILYGPQGEMRVEEKSVTVSRDVLNEGMGFYEVSLTQQNETTYRAFESNDPDKGQPHLAAVYEKSITENLTGRGGIRALQQQGDLSVYTYAGLVGIWNDYILNQDFVVTDKGTYSAAATARRIWRGHSLIARTEYRSEDFTTEPTAIKHSVPTTYNALLSSTGPFAQKYYDGMRYNADLNFFYRSGIETNALASFAVSARVKDLLINKGLSYQKQISGSDTIDADDEMEGFISVRGRLRDAGISWRGRLNYDVLPDMGLSRFNLNLSKSFSPQLSGQFETDHNFDLSYTTFSTALNILRDKYTISPTLSYDTDNNARAYVNLRFGLIYDPYAQEMSMNSQGLGNYGGVSAFVFLDKNGDGIFGDGDEEIEDVIVESIQSPRVAVSNLEGEALLTNLPTGRLTDIKIQEGSTFETNWMSGATGVSVLPRPGIISRVEFPILQGGEIDGTVYISKDDGSKAEASNVILYLNTPSGEKVLQSFAAYDGFYVFERVRPGIYYLTADTSRASFTGYVPPVKVIVSVNGDVFYGKNITLKRGFEIPFTFSSVNTPILSDRKSRVERVDDIAGQAVLLKIGPYKTDLMKTLSWYKIKMKYGNTISGLKHVEAANPKNEGFIILQPEKPGLTAETASLVCETFAQDGIPCGVEVVTVYKKIESPEKTASLN